MGSSLGATFCQQIFPYFLDSLSVKLDGRGTIVKLDRTIFDVTVFTFTGPVDDTSRYIHAHNGKTVMLEYKLTPAREAIAAVRSA